MTGRIQTVLFRGTVSANSQLVLVSRRISSPFRTRHFRLSFALNTNRTVDVQFVIAEGDNSTYAIATAEEDVFRQLSSNSLLFGDDQDIDIDHVVDCHRAGTFLKVVADNNDAFDHVIDAQVTIELFDRGHAF